MAEAIGIRLDEKFLKKLEVLGKEEALDRSSIIRKLVYIGYKDFMKNKVSKKYIQGKITISEAARQAGLTIWEMEEYLIDQGFKSSYSVEDLKNELAMI